MIELSEKISPPSCGGAFRVSCSIRRTCHSKGSGLVAGKPTAYVCVWNTCKHPVHHAWQLEQQIEALD